jgi:ComEC/Rec2-related protein
VFGSIKWRAYPALRVCLGFVLGIFAARYLQPEMRTLFIGVLICWTVASTAHFVFGLLVRWLTGVFIWGSLVLGAMLWYEYNNPGRIASPLPERMPSVQLAALVTKVPPTATPNCRLECQIIGVQKPEAHASIEGMYVQLSSDSLCQCIPGDTLIISGTIYKIQPIGVHGEGYDHYLINRKIHLKVFPDQLNLLPRQGKVGLFTHLAYRVRPVLVQRLKNHIPNTPGDFLVSLCFGYRIVDRDWITHFQRSGAMHILAISGLHVGIAAGVIRVLLARFFTKGNIAQFSLRVLSQTALWTFVALSGASDPAIRAGVMFTVWDWGKFIHRKTHWSQLLSISALIQLAYNPLAILQVGFQFSYAAVSAILLFSPWVQLATRWTPRPLRWLTGLTTVSLAAQAGVGGLSIYHFGQFPVWFLATNWLALPAASLLLIAGWAFLVADLLLPTAFVTGFATALHFLTDWFLRCIAAISTHSPAWQNDAYLPGLGLAGYLIALTFLIAWLHWRQWALLLFSIAAWTLFSHQLRAGYRAVVRHPVLTAWADRHTTAVIHRQNGRTYHLSNAPPSDKIPWMASRQQAFHRITWPTDTLTGAFFYVKNTQPKSTPGSFAPPDCIVLSLRENTQPDIECLCQCQRVLTPASEQERLAQITARCPHKPQTVLFEKHFHHCAILNYTDHD